MYVQALGGFISCLGTLTTNDQGPQVCFLCQRPDAHRLCFSWQKYFLWTRGLYLLRLQGVIDVINTSDTVTPTDLNTGSQLEKLVINNDHKKLYDTIQYLDCGPVSPQHVADENDRKKG